MLKIEKTKTHTITKIGEHMIKQVVTGLALLTTLSTATHAGVDFDGVIRARGINVEFSSGSSC